MLHPKFRCLMVVLPLALCACINEEDKADPLNPPKGTPEASTFDGAVARAWFDLLTDSIAAEGLDPTEASRRIGYAGATLYEAVVGGMPDHLSLGGQLNGLGGLPEVPNKFSEEVHWPAVANTALAAVLTDLFSGASAPTLQAISDLDSTFQAQFAGEVGTKVFDRSIAHGAEIAAAIVGWTASDGYSVWHDCVFTPPIGPGLWIPTPPTFTAAPLEPCWGNLRPFALLFGAECAPLPPPPFSQAPGSAFALEGQEVHDVGNSLTPDQMDIALFWEDAPGTPTAPGHWVRITSQVVAQQNLDLAVAAEAFAKVGLAVADASIACWEIKYYHDLLRPVTYIQDPTGPINAPGWTSFVATPPYPGYTSDSAAQAGAAALVLTDLLGDVAFTDDTYAGVPLAARGFAGFEEAAGEAALAGLYGGIHFRSDVERGLDQGRCVAGVLLRDIHFRK